MAEPPLKTPRTCPQCGHNAKTCATEHGGGFKLFGVRLTAAGDARSPVSSLSTLRKSVSMNNLSQPQDWPSHSGIGVGVGVCGAGYDSDDAIHGSSRSRSRERKRGVPWTEDEHMLFLMGLHNVGKGDWRGISRKFVKTRTPTQVASHAQKYFLRRSNVKRRRRHRFSLFDITTDTVISSSIGDQTFNHDSIPPKAPAFTKKDENLKIGTFPKPFTKVIPPTSSTKQQTPPIPVIPLPPSTKMAKLNLNQSPSSSHGSRDIQSHSFISLKPSSEPLNEEAVTRASTFGRFDNNGDNIISVA